mgnify:CR=1 FL=1
MDAKVADKEFAIAGKKFSSRFLIGTSRYPNQQVMMDAIEASGAEETIIVVRATIISISE